MLSSPGRLEFPWPDAPPPGEARAIAPGLLWARLPLPFRLNHVNVWLIEESDGWTVIDTGCATPEIIATWESLLAGPMKGRGISRLVVTHGHVDHIGLAGWMVSRFDAVFVGTFAEWLWARLSHIHDVPGSAKAFRDYLARHGFDQAMADIFVKSRGRFIDLSTTVPGTIKEIRHGDMLRMGARDWRVIVTRGHAFEHASFYNAESNILIAGDHLLPKISPVIAVYEMAPDSDPLNDYLTSFPYFDDVAGDALILPSHGLPYNGLRTRISELRDHHRQRLAVSEEFLRQPMTALQLATEMFPHIRESNDVAFALGETLAHVNYLLRRGAVADISDNPGRSLFQTVP